MSGEAENKFMGKKSDCPSLISLCVCVFVCVCVCARVLAGGLAVRFSHYQWSGICLILLNCECQIDVLFSLMFCFYTLRHWISRKSKARVSFKWAFYDNVLKLIFLNPYEQKKITNGDWSVKLQNDEYTINTHKIWSSNVPLCSKNLFHKSYGLQKWCIKSINCQIPFNFCM